MYTGCPVLTKGQSYSRTRCCVFIFVEEEKMSCLCELSLCKTGFVCSRNRSFASSANWIPKFRLLIRLAPTAQSAPWFGSAILSGGEGHPSTGL